MARREDAFNNNSLLQHHLAVSRALLARENAGLVITDVNLRVLESNVKPTMFGGAGMPLGSLIHEFFSAQDASEVERRLRQVVEEGMVLSGLKVGAPALSPDGRPGVVSLTAARLEKADGKAIGLVIDLQNVSEQDYAQQRLQLLHRAADEIGASLDVQRTTQDLADLLVPAIADLAIVFLVDSVFIGEEAPELPGVEHHHLQCAAVQSRGTWPSGMISPGEELPYLPAAPTVLTVLQHGNAIVTNAHELTTIYGEQSPLVSKVIPPGGRSAVVTPLVARGLALGSVVIWRTEREAAFDSEDAQLLLEIASRAALSVDNARRFTREHRAAVSLQRSLLPASHAQVTAAQTAGVYRPATSRPGVGGDWFDAIALPSLRVAFVMGDVVGHGLEAAAMMGRLRAAVRTVAHLDLAPDEVLMQLNDLVQELAAEADEAAALGADGIGATCLYAVYDPITRHCEIASAGHPPPALVSPEGVAEFVELAPGPPLGVSNMPFEVTEISVEPTSILALYTDGLVEQQNGDIGAGMERLKSALTQGCRQGCNLSEEAEHMITQLSGAPTLDDAALLLARAQAVMAENTTTWEFPPDPEIVAQARAVTARQLDDWRLAELAFSTELIVSELVTNAIRYGDGAVQMRLIRDRVLICEVSDGSNTQPRLRRARSTDEGGRGLFLVAQLASRWGCRYGHHGKTIWVEQPLLNGIDAA
jgi:serine phosphatase RsbU (regulator of sigma subunit)/anti-sigma regulatory factor (Ser/Thr protein kinase)